MKRTARRIVVLGSTNTDMVIAGKRIPVPGETVSGGRFMMNPGGKGANQAVAVALAEGRTCAEAIDFAQKAAAIAVTRPGAQSSVPWRKEVK